MIEERYELAAGRLSEILSEEGTEGPFREYFQFCAGFLGMLAEEFDWIERGNILQASLEELQTRNRKLYEDIIGDAYDSSYGNPAYAVRILGEEFGGLLSFLYAELRSAIPWVYEQDREELVIRMELFLEIYVSFRESFLENQRAPGKEDIRKIIYWFVSDYSEIETEKRIRFQLDPSQDYAVKIIQESSLENPRYLYLFGEYITENEIKTAEYLAKLPEEVIASMADTFTEGYRIGFEVNGRDISRKKTVNIRYVLGFERMVKRAVENFKAMGLESIIYRAYPSTFHRRGVHKIGYMGAAANKQYDYDHKEDEAVYLDKLFVQRKLEVLKAAFEKYKEPAAVHGGPACVETFGELPFVPKSKPEAFRLSEEQQKLSVEFAQAAGMLTNEYIKGDERSFTIIAFPAPEIGERFDEIFHEIIRINTLDYKRYQKIQQTIIDTLDLGTSVIVKGMGGNRTDLIVSLQELKKPDKETNFENCVADVNIPVGEVFTSPKLEGTNGILHVSRVLLNELEFKNLELVFEEGMVASYSCGNFETLEENRQYVMDNVLYHHESLPLGEFAVGTNTAAYVMAEKYGIADKLPILIAEKMGPHFAVGDTCYSHSEEVRTYNPDGKEITAKDNSVSVLRKTEPSKAYLNCHTDITIPYDELGELSVMTKEGDKIPVILEGRFVLPGCEELNKPFE